MVVAFCFLFSVTCLKIRFEIPIFLSLSSSPPPGSDQRTWTVADSESPSAASACSVLEGRRPGTGGSSSGGVTSDGPSTPATEGISTTVLASPVTAPASYTPQQIISPAAMEVLVEGVTGVWTEREEEGRGAEHQQQQLAGTGVDVTGTGENPIQQAK